MKFQAPVWLAKCPWCEWQQCEARELWAQTGLVLHAMHEHSRDWKQRGGYLDWAKEHVEECGVAPVAVNSPLVDFCGHEATLFPHEAGMEGKT
jgi:hypothetical protein